MRNQTKDEIVQIVQKILTQHQDISLALIFGSVAKGTFIDSSDLDLAVAGSSPLSPEEKLNLIQSLSDALHREVDLVDLRVATGTVFKQALTTSVPIVLKDPMLLARCASRMVFEDADFHGFRRKLMKDRRKKVFDGQ